MSNYIKNNHKMDIYSDFVISHSGYATATELSRIFSNNITHDQITHLLNNKEIYFRSSF